MPRRRSRGCVTAAMQVQELRGNIRVHVRVRPCEGGSTASALHCEDGHRIACTALGATKVVIAGR